MENKHNGDSIADTRSPLLPYHSIEIKPKTVLTYNHTIDAPIMGMLFTFTIMLAVYWLVNSLNSWEKLYSDLRKCL